MKENEIFVPGRIGIIGEVSDLVSPYLKDNKKLVPGCAIAMPIKQGIYATYKKNNLLYVSMKNQKFSVLFTEEKLEAAAKDENNFFSYICGTSLYMKKKYNVGGISINITKMDLPLKSGLSSSAAICILVVRAFDKIYGLNLTKEQEIEASYEGEHLSMSNCGKLDQTTICENKLVKLDFYYDKVVSTEIKCKKQFYIVVSNLNGNKNTSKIMKDLNSCFPFYKNKKEKKVHEMMSIKNRKIVEDCVKYIEKGNIKKLGKKVNQMQKLKDLCSDVCSEYLAPKLHTIFKDKYIRKKSYGMKDVGSGGDGSVEIIAKNERCMKEICEYIENKYGYKSIYVTISN